MALDSQRVQLNRALSKLGLASRVEATKAIRAGLVQVNGKPVRASLTWVTLGLDRISLAGQSASVTRQHRYLALNKPKGPVVTRSDELGRETVHALLPVMDRVRPAKNLLGASVSLVVFRNHEEIRRCGASGA